jgi:hypothetical protein
LIRKLVLGLAAAAVVAGAALAPTSASAGGFHHHHHHRHVFFAPAPIFVAPVVPPSCLQKRLVPTPLGLRWRIVNVCAF